MASTVLKLVICDYVNIYVTLELSIDTKYEPTQHMLAMDINRILKAARKFHFCLKFDFGMEVIVNKCGRLIFVFSVLIFHFQAL